MGPTLVFRVFGFPVAVRTEFFIFFAIFGSGLRRLELVAAWIAIAFVSILVHELGHATVARAFGCRSTIVLHGMGGTTYPVRAPGTPPLAWSADLAIALAGPAFGLALGMAVWLAARLAPAFVAHEPGPFVVEQLLWVNLGWSLINLAPILPYDGGLATRAVLVRLFGDRGDRASHMLTIGLAAAVVAAAIALRSRWSSGIWLAYLALRGAAGSWTALRRARDDRAIADAWTAWDALDFAKAREIAGRVAREAKDPAQLARAQEMHVFACLAVCDAAGARAAYDAYPAGFVPSTCLRALVALDGADGGAAALLRDVPEPVAARVLLPLLIAWANGGWEERATEWLDAKAVDALPRGLTRELGSRLFFAGRVDAARHLLETRFEVTREAQDAYNVACCCARLHACGEALGWLGRALDAGWDDGAAIDRDEDLAPLRALDGFSALRARLAPSL